MCFLMADFSRINKLKKGRKKKQTKNIDPHSYEIHAIHSTSTFAHSFIRALIHSPRLHILPLFIHTHRQQDLNTLGTVQIPFGTHTHSCTHPHCHSRSQKKRKKNHAVFCAASINWDGCKCRIVTIITVSRSLSLFGFRFGFSFSLLWFRRFFSIFLLTSLP